MSAALRRPASTAIPWPPRVRTGNVGCCVACSHASYPPERVHLCCSNVPPDELARQWHQSLRANKVEPNWHQRFGLQWGSCPPWCHPEDRIWITPSGKNPRNAPAPQGTVELPLSTKGKDVSATVGIVVCRSSI